MNPVTSSDNLVYKCTACTKKIKSSFDAYIHPLIDCLICRNCYHNYNHGDFSKMPDGVDEFGDDNYCRWCCDGGDLFGCARYQDDPKNRCHYAFCKECISRNVPDDPILTETMTWSCYGCDKSRIAPLIKNAELVIQALNEIEMQKTMDEPDLNESTIDVTERMETMRPENKKTNNEPRTNGTNNPVNHKHTAKLNPNNNKSPVKPLLIHEAILKKVQCHRRTNELCVKEIDKKFETIYHLFAQKDLQQKPILRRVLDIEITGLKTVLKEFELMVDDLSRIRQSI